MAKRARTGAPAFSLFAFQDIITCVMGIMLLLTLMMSLQVNVSPGSGMDDKMQVTIQKLADETQKLLRDTVAMEARVEEQLAVMKSNALLDTAILEKSRNQVSADVTAATRDLNRVKEVADAAAENLKGVGLEFEKRQADVKETRRLEQEIQEIQKNLEELRSGNRKIYNAHDSAAKTCWLIELSTTRDIKVAELGQQASPRLYSSVQQLLEWMKGVSSDDVAFMILLKPEAAELFDQISETLIRLRIPFGFDLLPQDATAIEKPTEGAVE